MNNERASIARKFTPKMPRLALALVCAAALLLKPSITGAQKYCSASNCINSRQSSITAPCTSPSVPHPRDPTVCCHPTAPQHCCHKPLNPLLEAGKDNYFCCLPSVSSGASATNPSCCLSFGLLYGSPPRCCRTGSTVNVVNFCCPSHYFPSSTDSQCCLLSNPASCCELPLLPSGNGSFCCMEPGNDQEVVDVDDPEYQLVYPDYMPEMLEENTIHADQDHCDRREVVQEVFGNQTRLNPLSKVILIHSVPLDWSPQVQIPQLLRPKVLVESLAKIFWPEVILPFLYPIMVVVLAALLAIPIALIGGIAWAILFNLRFLGHKRIRMTIRYLLIQLEKYRRWKYEWSFPRDHLRKFRQRDRYQLPKAFQDSDLSSDDEPDELQRDQIPRKETTMYTEEEIEKYGYDPSNIPMEWIYGDLIGNPTALAKSVKEYLQTKRRGRAKDTDGEFDRASLKSEEIADFLGKADYYHGPKENFQPAVWDTKKEKAKKKKMTLVGTRQTLRTSRVFH